MSHRRPLPAAGYAKHKTPHQASPLTIFATALLTSTHIGPALTSLPFSSSIPHFLFQASLHPLSVSFCFNRIS